MKCLDGKIAPEATIKLLDRLHQAHYPNNYEWRDWQATRLKGGRNNLVYRAQQSDQKVVLKFTTPDQRDRAGREYLGLLCLQQAGLNIAPLPLLLDRTSYQYPVVVQTWLDGEFTHTPPNSDHDWLKLLEHFVLIHKAVPSTEAKNLPAAALSMVGAESGKEHLEKQFLLIPQQKRSRTIRTLFEKSQSTNYPTWSKSNVVLCRCDPSPSNFARRSDIWCSVDWENSGWGDPAFEIADMMAHPSYQKVNQSRWDWLIDAYAYLMSDSEAPRRIRVYYAQMIIWWSFRLSRELSAPAMRLAGQAPSWELEASYNLAHYLSISENCGW